MKSRRYRRKSRKMRKIRKTKRGGSPAPPAPISEPIQFRAYDDAAENFNPNNETPESMRAKFSLALISNLRHDDPTYDRESPQEELDLPFKILRKRGEVDDPIFVGTMTDWDNNKINDFLLGLQPGDNIILTIA